MRRSGEIQMAVIAVFNQKGGVGKTTTALNLHAGLALLKTDPLAIDLDPQGHLTLACGAKSVAIEQSVYSFFEKGVPLERLMQTVPSGRRLIASTLDLSKVDALRGGDTQIALRLKNGIHAAFGTSSAPVIIDCCPMLSVLTMNALIAADRVLIPVAADFLSLQGVGRLDRALNVLEAKFGRRIERRVVVTRFDARRKLSFAIYDELKSRYGAALCATRIVENVNLAESPMHGKDIYAFAPASPGARDYRALIEELGSAGFFA
jgi:chromosome partitioning protein